MALGLPGPKSEAWKYTPLGRLARAAFVLVAGDSGGRARTSSRTWSTARMHFVFVNGHFAADLSDAESADQRRDDREPRRRAGARRSGGRSPPCRSPTPGAPSAR